MLSSVFNQHHPDSSKDIEISIDRDIDEKI
jgi:hypothetical protein